MRPQIIRHMRMRRLPRGSQKGQIPNTEGSNGFSSKEDSLPNSPKAVVSTGVASLEASGTERTKRCAIVVFGITVAVVALLRYSISSCDVFQFELRLGWVNPS